MTKCVWGLVGVKRPIASSVHCRCYKTHSIKLCAEISVIHCICRRILCSNAFNIDQITYKEMCAVVASFVLAGRGSSVLTACVVRTVVKIFATENQLV